MRDYKRFTEFKPYRKGESKGRYIQYCVTGCYNDMNSKGDYTTGESVNRLAELEDKIENGTLIELPCKVGDVVYAFVFEIEPHIEQYSVIAIEIGIETFIRCFEAKRGLCYLRPTSIFLTKAEAEKKLEELRSKK